MPGLDVVYLDNHLLVVNKPAGILVQADRTGDADLLSLGKAFLKERFQKPGNVFLGLVHRLDRPVSGLIVFGRTSKAASRLSEQFRQRTVEKRYLAIVEGTLAKGGTFVDYLVKEQERVRVVPADYPGAQRAELEARVVATRQGRTLVDVRLKTGRPHQIRVQFASRGHPLVGDGRYGRSRGMLLLHCYYLGVEHPTQKETLAWTAPPPGTWDARFQNDIEHLLSC